MLDLDDDVVRERFLLNSLAPADREAVEDRLVADPDYFERLSALEDELILRWLQGELPSEDRRRFAEVYMSSPARRARVEATRETVAAAAALRAEPPPPRDNRVPRRWSGARDWFAAPVRLPRFAVAGVVLVLLVGVTSLVQRAGVGRGAETERLVLVATLAPVPLRSEGAETNLVRIGAVAADVWLRFEIPSIGVDDALQFEIRDVDRDAVDVVPAGPVEIAYAGSAAFATAKISAERLPDGDYVLTLFRAMASGTREVIATRTFRVVRG